MFFNEDVSSRICKGGNIFIYFCQQGLVGGLFVIFKYFLIWLMFFMRVIGTRFYLIQVCMRQQFGIYNQQFFSSQYYFLFNFVFRSFCGQLVLVRFYTSSFFQCISVVFILMFVSTVLFKVWFLDRQRLQYLGVGQNCRLLGFICDLLYLYFGAGTQRLWF